MSAIFGIYSRNGGIPEEKYLIRMKDILKPYGIDADGLILDISIGLGACLSKISNNSRTEEVVYRDTAKDIILISDALIFNRSELQQQLCGGRSVSTQELLMRAYGKWGVDCPRYLNGDYTFAIWDRSESKLFLFRDHLGVRPMYYFNGKNIFAFASDYRALLALPFVGKGLDEVMLYAKLRDIYHIDTESTYFTCIKRLPQAHYLEIGETGIRKQKYWIPGQKVKTILQDEDEYAHELYRIVEDSIRIRIREVSSGICSEFSGGLDSSVITVLAHRELKETGFEMSAYSWSPDYELLEKQKEDERELIDSICSQEKIQCNYEAFLIDPKEELVIPPVLTDGQRSEGIRRILKLMSSRGIKAVISGWGGDEGISHRADLYELIFSKNFGYFLKEAYGLSGGSKLRFIKRLVTTPLVILRRPYSFLGAQDDKIPDITQKAFEQRIKKQCKKDILYLKINPIKHLEGGASVSRTELMAWLGADEQIQYLFPFLDYRVIDYALSIPRHLFYKRGISRYIYRKAFEKLFPEKSCLRRGKIDYAREEYVSKREDLQSKAEMVIEMIDRDMFDSYIAWDMVKRLVDEKYFLEYNRESLFTLNKLFVCYDIQRILADAVVNSRY